ncbi:diguanylate cyclase [Acidovorax sp. HDW3]|uniref:diguanylate cyclase n=1 Tax=Acidovorax sp. HDW3 TaxID=2714923 RepID=UPI001F10B31B|nr:diguanylate cyclase [Acidovorax sp. HDW3]
MLLALGAYWAVQFDSARAQREATEQQAWLRAEQVARAVAVQVQTLVSGLDYSLRTMQTEWQERHTQDFAHMVHSTLQTYPRGAVLQVAVADAGGRIVYSSLQPSGAVAAPVSIAEREHFQVHQKNPGAGLFVGPPVQGKVSGQWSVQLSRALYRQGRFDGAIVLSVSPQYLAGNFRAMFDDPQDVIALLRDDGLFLARSHLQEQVLGQSVPPERVRLFADGQLQGRYVTAAPVDGVERMYAWHRVGDLALIVSAGLERRGVFAAVDTAIGRSMARNVAASVLVLLGSALLLWLSWLHRQSELQRWQSKKRFERLTQEVPGGLFQYCRDAKGRGQLVFASAAFDEMHGVQVDTHAPLHRQLAQRVHPDDLPVLLATIEASVVQCSDWEHTYRVYNEAQQLRWLHGHAHPHTEPGEDTLWHGYVHDVTEAQELQQALRESEERLRLSIEAVGDGLWVWDCISGQVQWDARCYEMLGYAPESFPMSYAAFMALVHPEDASRLASELHQHIDMGSEFRVDVRLRTQALGWLWVQSRGKVTLRNAQGQPLRMMGVHMDVQQRVAQERLLYALMDRFPSGILLADPQAQRIRGANRRLVQILELAQAPDALEGQSLADLPAALLPLLLPEGQALRGKHSQQLVDGRYLELQGWVLRDADGTLAHCWVVNDVTERKRREAQLQSLALTDALTGVPNRRAFFQRVEMELAHLRSGLVGDAVLIMLDIDHFKHVNDSYGHAVGDVVLKALVAQVARQLRRGDMLGRIGGEEFAVLLSGANMDVGMRRAESLRHAVAESAVEVPGLQAPIHYAISLGVAPLQPEDDTVDAILERADAALYYSKRNGRNQSTLWRPDLPAITER